MGLPEGAQPQDKAANGRADLLAAKTICGCAERELWDPCVTSGTCDVCNVNLYFIPHNILITFNVLLHNCPFLLLLLCFSLKKCKNNNNK